MKTCFLLRFAGGLLAAFLAGCAGTTPARPPAPAAMRAPVAAPPVADPASRATATSSAADERYSQTLPPVDGYGPAVPEEPGPAPEAPPSPETLDAEAVRHLALIQRRPSRWAEFLARWDANHDGDIDAAEYARHLEWHELRTSLKPVYDLDGDGRIDPGNQEHFSRAVRELNEAYFAKPD